MKQIPPLVQKCFLLCLMCCLFIWHDGWEEATYAAPNHRFGIQLPAPLYVLQNNREIIRIEPDGQITTAITDPRGGIDEFDVSPVHGRLAYIMGGQLVEVDPQSGRRVEKFNAFHRNRGRLSAPRYAPDGNHIIFIMQGTLWSTRSGLDLDSAVTRMLSEETLDIPSNLFPLGKLFTASWSPKGSQILLVEKRVYGNDYRYLMLDLETKALTMVGRSWPDPVTCCTIGWSPDGEVAAVTNVRRESESGYERAIEQSLAHTAVVGLTARGGQYQVDLPPCDAHPHYTTGCGLLALLPQVDQTALALRQSRANDPNQVGAILYYDRNQWTEVGLTTKVTVGAPLLWSPHNDGFITLATGNTPRGGYPIQTVQWLGVNIPAGDLLTIDLALEQVTQLHWGVSSAVTGLPPSVPTPAPPPLPVITTSTALQPTATQVVLEKEAWSTTMRLPAELYLIDAGGALSRLRDTGGALRQEALVAERAPIDDFDVSPVHGRIIYITENQLIEFDPATGERVVKVPAPSVEMIDAIENQRGELEYRLYSARYAPDGQQIAFVQGGINLIASGLVTGQVPSRLIGNVYFGPPPPAASLQWSTNIGRLRVYSELDWSPDGRRLLLGAGQWEGGIYEIYDLDKEEMTPHLQSTVTDLPLTWGWQWGNDSTHGYVASNGFLRGHPVDIETGLSQVDAATGAATLIDVGTYATMDRTDRLFPRAITAVHELPNQELLFFMDIATRMDWMEYKHHLALMHRADDGTLTQEMATTFRQEGEILWAPDGSGAIFVQEPQRNIGETGHELYPLGSLYWLAREEQAFVPLQIQGHHLRWGSVVTETVSTERDDK